MLLYECMNEDKRNMISARLIEYAHTTNKEDCGTENLSTNRSLVTVYGIGGESNKMFVKQFWPCSELPIDEPMEFRGFERIFVQFYREPYHAKTRPQVDQIKMDFTLNPVKSK